MRALRQKIKDKRYKTGTARTGSRLVSSHEMLLPARVAQLLLLAVILLFASCNGAPEKKKTDWTPTLSGSDKNPYGAYLARQSLQHYFPQARIEDLARYYRYSSMGSDMLYGAPYDSAALLVLVGFGFSLNNEEWARIQDFAETGNEVLLFCSRLDSRIARALQCDKQVTGGENQPLSQFNTGEDMVRRIALTHDGAAPQRPAYGYRGRSIDGYFSTEPCHGGAWQADTSERSQLATAADSSGEDEEGYSTSDKIIPNPEVLGLRNAYSAKPGYGQQFNFVRYAVGKGHITLHAAPLVLSNYFLLQGNNRAYLDGIWHSLPNNISAVYWNEYYIHRAEKNDLSVLWKYAATRNALIIAILTILLYVLSEMRRRQRIIPVIPPLANSSVSFVETVGQLYYHQRNHANLAGKMIQHFLEWVRRNFHLETNQLSEEFTLQLSKRSGVDLPLTKELVNTMLHARATTAAMSDAELHHLYNLIQTFYARNPSVQ